MLKEELFQKFELRLYDIMKNNNIKGVTELSRITGIGQSTLSTLLTKQRLPRLDTIYLICEGLGLSLQEFFDAPPFNENTTTDLLLVINKLSENQRKQLELFLETFNLQD